MEELIGKKINRYKILEKLGQGGMAIVYKAWDSTLKRNVALKLIRRSAFSQEILDQVLKRFEREAISSARLNHPNIVKVYDYGKYEGMPWIVMQYMEGGTLFERMKKPIPYYQAAQLLIPIAKAISYANKEGVLHRDVKPANILFSKENEPYLADFGIARILESEAGETLTGTGIGIGTPEYMSLEQARGEEIDERSDLYSLGVVYYELITGKKPYSAKTPMDVILKKSNELIPSPKLYINDLPEIVEEVLEIALARDKENRFRDLDQFCNILENLSKKNETIIQIGSKVSNTTLKQQKRAQLKRKKQEIFGNDQNTLIFDKSQTIKEKIDSDEVKGKKYSLILKIIVPFLLIIATIVWMVSGINNTLSHNDVNSQETLNSESQVVTNTSTEEIENQEPTNEIQNDIAETQNSSIIRKLDGMEMLHIPAGEYQMGSNVEDIQTICSENSLGNCELDQFVDETPLHSVKIDQFWIDKTEITIAMFANYLNLLFMDQSFVENQNMIFIDGSYKVQIEYIENEWQVVNGMDNYPIVGVTWSGAAQYCDFHHSRLPFEAEWEFAARGDDSRLWPWGNEFPDSTFGNFDYYFNGVYEVGMFSPNGDSPFGVQDMAGNVMEWVLDGYNPEFYQISNSENPVFQNRGGLPNVLRGGSWKSNILDVRVANRDFGEIYLSNDEIGFRCVTTEEFIQYIE